MLCAVIVLIALTGFVRMHQAILQWSFLSSLERVSPAYILTTGLLWGIFGLATGLLLWLRWSQAGVLALAFLISFSVYLWIDQLLISASPEQFLSWPFMLAVDLLGLAWAAWVVDRAGARGYFAEPELASGSENGGLDG